MIWLFQQRGGSGSIVTFLFNITVTPIKCTVSQCKVKLCIYLIINLTDLIITHNSPIKCVFLNQEMVVYVKHVASPLKYAITQESHLLDELISFNQ